MAILKNDPVSCFLAFLNHFLSNGPLTLTEGYRFDGFLFGLGEGAERGKRIWSRTENEDKWWSWSWIAVDFGKIEGWRWYEFLTELWNNIVLNGGDHLIGSDCSQNEEFIELCENCINFFRHFFILWLLWVIDLPPGVGITHDAFHEDFVFLHLGQPVDLAPAFGGDPFSSFRFFRKEIAEGDSTCQQKSESLIVDLLFEFGQSGAEKEWEKQLVFFEEGSADVGVERIEEIIFEVFESEGEVGWFFRFGDGHSEEIDVVGQWVLVHGIDIAQIGDGKEEARSLLTDGFVLLSCGVDVLFSYAGDFLFLLDFGGFFFGGCQDVDGLFIEEDVFIRGQHFQNLLLNFKEFFLIGCSFKNKSFLFLLKIGSFLLDDDAQKLIVQTLIGDHEVDKGHFSGYFRKIVGISVFGGDVENKFAGILNDLVTQFHINCCSFLIGLFQKDGVESWIQFLAYIF